MVLGIFIPDGVGIKNYLYTDFLSKFLGDPQNKVVLLYTSMEVDILNEIIAPYPAQAILQQLPAFKENIKLRVIRESITIGRLLYFTKKLSNPSIMEAVPTANNFNRKLLIGIASALGKSMSGNYQSILRWEKKCSMQVSQLDVTAYENIFRACKIDTIMSLHQRPVENIAIYEAARRLQLQRIAVIYSWDNLAKARLYTPSDKYLLWSAYMKSQVQLFYPEIPESKLVVTGTPQFSFYFKQEYRSSRSAFCKQWLLNEEASIILFSGSDYRTSPYDPYLLRDVAEAILQLKNKRTLQLVFRRTPADFSGRYDWVFKKYPWIIKMDPLWINKGTTWTTAVPTKNDLKNVVGIIEHCSLVINVASTMALDAATHNKPCIYLSYNPEEARKQGAALFNDTHLEDHFKVMKDIDAVAYVEHEEKLASVVEQILENPEDFCTQKNLYLQRVTDNIFIEAADNIVKELTAKTVPAIG